MKWIVLLSMILISGFAYADYVEVKRASGTSYSNYSSNLYVCYHKRIKVVSDGEMYLSYRGCTRENRRCKNIGKVHFGKYPSSQKAENALSRCQNSQPRFVD